MFKKILMNKSNDELLLNIQSMSFIIMIICVLLFFPINKFLPFLLKWIFLIFGVFAILGFGIIIIWFVKDFIIFKEKVYDPKFIKNDDENTK